MLRTWLKQRRTIANICGIDLQRRTRDANKKGLLRMPIFGSNGHPQEKSQI